MPTSGIPAPEKHPHLSPHQPFPWWGRDGGARRDVVTPLVSVRFGLPWLVFFLNDIQRVFYISLVHRRLRCVHMNLLQINDLDARGVKQAGPGIAG